IILGRRERSQRQIPPLPHLTPPPGPRAADRPAGAHYLLTWLLGGRAGLARRTSAPVTRAGATHAKQGPHQGPPAAPAADRLHRRLPLRRPLRRRGGPAGRLADRLDDRVVPERRGGAHRAGGRGPRAD